MSKVIGLTQEMMVLAILFRLVIKKRKPRVLKIRFSNRYFHQVLSQQGIIGYGILA